MTSARGRCVRTAVTALLGTAILAGCALFGPPYSSMHPVHGSSARGAPLRQSSAAPQVGVGGAVNPALPLPAQSGAPPPVTPSNAVVPPYALDPAAQALIAEARGQEHRHNFGLAAETLERALSIEPANPRIWLEFARERLAAGQAAAADGMARKALYLATGNARLEARAWGMIAATLRAEGRRQAAISAEQRAAELSMQ